jgi:hypothetical protein
MKGQRDDGKAKRPPLKLDFHILIHLIQENQTLAAVEVNRCTVAFLH